MSSLPGKKRVLILCTGNSCRSQIAEALWRHEAGDRYEVFSAGTEPRAIHPLTARVLQEFGISLAGQRSKHVDEFAGQRFDLVVTVCGHAAATCPVFSGAARTQHWPFDDPAAAAGSDAELLTVFRWVRDQIHRRIREHLASDNR
jgi:arsenate reductase